MEENKLTAPSLTPTKYRVLKWAWVRFVANTLLIAGLTVTVFYIFHFSFFGKAIAEPEYFFLVLALFMPLGYIYIPFSSRYRDQLPWYDIVAALFSFCIPFYFFTQGMNIRLEGWEYSPPLHCVVIGIILWALVIEISRRSGSLIFAIIILVISLYPLFAESMPGILMGKNVGLDNLVGYHTMGPEGIIGIPIRVLARILVGFLLFSIVLIATGGGEFFLKLAASLLGKTRGGAAKVSVISSAFFGSLSGSIAANILTTGSFTIPAMRKSGYPNHYAAAIETCASTGGVLMPPVMGSTAFVMAQMLKVPYFDVCIAALVPSVLYYLGLLVQIDGFAAKKGLKGIEEDMPPIWQILKEGYFYILSFVFLILLLAVFRLEAQAPFYAIIPLVVFSQLHKKTRIGIAQIKTSLTTAGRLFGEITALLAGVGLLIGAVFLTGLGVAIPGEILDLAGGNLVALVMLGALASFILGMGVTVTACYLLLAILLVPSLIQAGIHPMAAHLFIIYTGMLSFITPPVALGAYIAASFAGAPPMRTAVRACILGAVKFVIPFLFVFEPAFVMVGAPVHVAYVICSGILGVIFLGSGLEGYLIWVGRLSATLRCVSLAAGVLLFLPGWHTDVIGAVLAFVLLMRVGSKRGATE